MIIIAMSITQYNYPVTVFDVPLHAQKSLLRLVYYLTAFIEQMGSLR